MIDSVLVVTDRRILDKQIRNTIKQFMQVKNTVTWAEHSGDLRKAIQDGKRIIISTIEKFPYIISEIARNIRITNLPSLSTRHIPVRADAIPRI